jgi:ABC-type glutathione transport system ATPase component
MEGRTSITVAHRLSTVRYSDRIFVFMHGKIVQAGTHDELMMDKEGEYYKLVERQASSMDEQQPIKPAAKATFAKAAAATAEAKDADSTDDSGADSAAVAAGAASGDTATTATTASKSAKEQDVKKSTKMEENVSNRRVLHYIKDYYHILFLATWYTHPLFPCDAIGRVFV